MKNILILGGGGFIGGHLAKRLKSEGNFIRIVDIKNHEYFDHSEICDEFILGDLREEPCVSEVMKCAEGTFDEVYQLAADMGGALYIFTGEHDAEVMHNSALINLQVVKHSLINNVGRVFYSSSACIYPEHNQLDPDNPNCEESSAYPANPDSEYGWEKLFSERLYLSFLRNHGLKVRVARFHNIYGPQGTWKGGREKAPAAMCRKAAETPEGGEIEVWGDGEQTRSFLYINRCVEAVLRFMRQEEFPGPVNIGSEEKVTINDLAQMAIAASGKNLKIKNLYGSEFIQKYGHKCPLGVRGRNSDNRLFIDKIGWNPEAPLVEGISKTFDWITNQVAPPPTPAPEPPGNQGWKRKLLAVFGYKPKMNDQNMNIYRLGDVVAFGAPLNFTIEKYPRSIGADVLRYGHATQDDRIRALAKVVAKRGVPIVEKGTVLVHLRTGDIVEKDKRSVDDMLCGEIAVANGDAGISKQIYVRPLSYHKLLASLYKKKGASRVVIVAGKHLAPAVRKSKKCIERVKKCWENHGYEVAVRFGGEPDSDFLYLCGGQYFVPSGGGFSEKVIHVRRLLQLDKDDIQYPGEVGKSFFVQSVQQWKEFETFLAGL